MVHAHHGIQDDELLLMQGALASRGGELYQLQL